MEFTPQEKKWINRLRKEQRRWPRMRWFSLGAGIFTLLCYSFIVICLFQILDHAFSDDVALRFAWVLVFAVLWPKCILGFIIGSWLTIRTLINWRGHANHILLLRLLDANQKQTDAERGFCSAGCQSHAQKN
jgi:hypothetical protein